MKLVFLLRGFFRIKTVNKNMKRLLPFIFIAAVGCNDAGKTNENQPSMDSANKTTISLPEKKEFQKTIDGKPVELYILKNGNIEAAVTN